MDNKDLIKQYIDTGFKIPEYQVIKLSNNDKKTYIRKRLIGSNLDDYEFVLLDEKEIWGYFMKVIADNGIIRDKMLTKTPEHLIHNLVDYTIDNKLDINADLFYFSSLEYKMRIINNLINRNQRLDYETLSYASDELLEKFVDNECNLRVTHHTWLNLNRKIYYNLPNPLKVKIIDTYIKIGANEIPEFIFYQTPIILQKKFVRSIINTGKSIDDDFYEDLLDDVAFEYLNTLVEFLKKAHKDTWFLYMSNNKMEDYKRLNNEQ